MSTLFQEQQALLGRQLAVLQRLQDGLRFSAGRLRWPIDASDLDNPEMAERLAAQTAVKYLNALRDNMDTLLAMIGKFEECCQRYGLLPCA
ncbi:hypothetical protein [Thermithiobacillus plumbiphilus]|uniref:Uncharacterized protein n=1 Tax=Thermithiobacillus plumbiphilus TaxID=1729899 RepID=A0ABU9D619_9PROT